MLVFFKQNLVLFSVPKTGTTAYSMALRRHADIVFGRRTKHLTVGKYHKKVAPFLQKTFGLEPDTVAVMREPVDHIRSWYKYRGRPKLSHTKHSTNNVSFDEYVLDVISDSPSPSASIGFQSKFLSMRGGKVPIHYLFAYENQPLIHEFLSDRFEKDLQIGEKNVSPDIPAPISPDVEAKLREARSEEFDLYQRIADAGGVLLDYLGRRR